MRLPDDLVLNNDGILKTRYCYGGPYIAVSAWKSQVAARAEARRLRRAGLLARVTQERRPYRSYQGLVHRRRSRTIWVVWQCEKSVCAGQDGGSR